MITRLMWRMGSAALLIAAACALAASPAHAAKLSERSPVRPGLWWDAERSGSGFEIHAAPGQLFVVWYTYRGDGAPVWYTAQGPMGTDGRFAAPLLRHRWSEGRYAGSTAVGTLAFQREHSERVVATFQIDGQGGVETITPYPIAGATPEIDHTGAWFDPAAAGFGLTIGEQGPWLTAAYYYYDGAGQPAWSFGTNGGSGSTVRLDRFSGACPHCAYVSPASLGGASLDLSFGADTALNARISGDTSGMPAEWQRNLALAMLTTPASRREADRALASFDDGARLKAYEQEAFAVARYPSTGVDFSAAPPPMPVSTTNLVEAGVDEADGVKTDGQYVYAVERDANGQSTSRVRVARIEGSGPQLSVLPSFWLDRGSNTQNSRLESSLYVDERRLVALSTTLPLYYYSDFGILPPESYQSTSTRIEIFDRRNPAAPYSIFRAELEGSLVTSRRIGDQIYLVHRWTPQVYGFQYGSDAATQAHNRSLIDATPVEAFLPSITVDGHAPVPMLAPQSVFLPPGASIAPSRDLICVTRINLAQPEDRETLAVVGTVETVYVSTTRMYLATTRYQPVLDASGVNWYGYTTTDIHQLSLDGGHPKLTASGAIEGWIGRSTENAPFRFSERNGKLRVMSSGDWGALGHNRLTVLEPSTIAPGVLRTVATLPNRARPQPIGKPDENLYATRFIDDKLYAVTYYKIDPLYVVSLTPESDPSIAGAVELPGFSEYLHPLPNGLLLGFGKDSVPGSSPFMDRRFDWYQGIKLALFDVRNPAAPRTLDEVVIGKRGSDSALLSDHHALSGLQLGDTFRFAVPLRLHGPNGTEPRYTPPEYYYPYLSSGLYAFDIDTAHPATARIAAYPPLITARASSGGYGYDDAAQDARSVLLPSGAIYVERSRFWFAPWNDLGHPVGPL